MISNRRNEILCAVKQKINENLDPSKSNYDAKITAKDILDSCEVSMEDYKWALSTSGDNDFELHLKRPVDSCFINNYFEAGIKGFRANVDLQPDEENDVQPNVLSDDLVESQYVQASDLILPKTIELINSKEIMNCRKIKAVIRFHYHHLLMLYLPWRKETELQGPNQLFGTKYYESSVKTIVDKNREIFELNAEAINIALQAFSENPTRHVHSYDVLNDQENDDLSSEVRDNVDDDCFNEDSSEVLVDIPETHQTSTGTICYTQPSAITDELLREYVKSLNRKQRFAYDFVLSWCRNLVKKCKLLKERYGRADTYLIYGWCWFGEKSRDKSNIPHCSKHV